MWNNNKDKDILFIYLFFQMHLNDYLYNNVIYQNFMKYLFNSYFFLFQISFQISPIP